MSPPWTYWNEAVSYNGVAEAYFPGYGTVPLNHYAPNGVSFDFVQAINDAGDILVLSGDQFMGNLNGGCGSYLLVPNATPEPSTVLLLATGLLGLLAYAWRKRK